MTNHPGRRMFASEAEYEAAAVTQATAGQAMVAGPRMGGSMPEPAPATAWSASEIKSMLDENPVSAQRVFDAELVRDGGPRKGVLRQVKAAAQRAEPMADALIDAVDQALAALEV